MLPSNKNYAVYPSVLPVGTETELTITACGRMFFFKENEEYDVTVIASYEDVADYYFAENKTKVKVVAKNGVLRFNFTPPKEGLNFIELYYNEKKLADFSVYSLEEDLYSLRPLKGDLHSHSYRSDGLMDASVLYSHYRGQGYDFFSLTDHNRFYPGLEVDETFEGVNSGFVRIPGEEVHAPDCIVHIVNNGSNSSVSEIYWKDKPRYDREVAEIEKVLPDSIPEVFRGRYARIMWVVENIHKAGGMATFAHPFWKPEKSRTNNVSEEFTRLLLKTVPFDAFELVGGATPADRNITSALWNDLRVEGLDIPVVGSSDVHNILKGPQTFSNYFTICFADENEAEEIKKAIKKGNSVAVEGIGYDYDRRYVCQGSYRLVSYARFLLETYFPEQQAILEGQGELLKRYSIGEDCKELIEAIGELAEKNYRRFFGKEAPVLPTEKMLKEAKENRARQLEGPPTKGSRIYGTTPTMQI